MVPLLRQRLRAEGRSKAMTTGWVVVGLVGCQQSY